MKQLLLIVLLACAAGVAWVVVSPKLTQSEHALSAGAAALIALMGVLYFAFQLARRGVRRAEARTSPAGPLVQGVLVSASFLLRSAAELAAQSGAGLYLEGFSLAFGLAAVLLLTRPRPATPAAAGG